MRSELDDYLGIDHAQVNEGSYELFSDCFFPHLQDLSNRLTSVEERCVMSLYFIL